MRQTAKTQGGTPEETIRPSRDFDCFGITKVLRDEPQMALSLKLILKDGSCRYYFYHELISPIEWNGSDELALNLNKERIVLKGTNLQTVAEYLAEHRVVWIKENDSSFKPKHEDGSAAVHQISVQRLT